MPALRLLVISPRSAPHLAELSALPSGVEFVVSDDPAVLVREAPTADAVLNCTGKGEPLRQIWPHISRVRWIHSLAAGVEDQLIPEVVSSPIPLTNARGVYKESLGEFVVGAVLFFAKDFRRMLRNQAAARWEPFDVEEIAKQTIGIVGYGEIGAAAGRRAKALGMRVLALRRKPASENTEVDAWFGPDQRVDMIRECDYVAVAAPLTAGTRGMIGAAEIAAMRRGAVVLNVGRGPVIDEPALIDALQARRIKGAALDVFETEPLPGDHPFWSLDNVLLSPHCADHTVGWLESSVRFFVENFRRFAVGEPLLNVVDKEAGY